MANLSINLIAGSSFDSESSSADQQLLSNAVNEFCKLNTCKVMKRGKGEVRAINTARATGSSVDVQNTTYADLNTSNTAFLHGTGQIFTDDYNQNTGTRLHRAFSNADSTNARYLHVKQVIPGCEVTMYNSSDQPMMTKIKDERSAINLAQAQRDTLLQNWLNDTCNSDNKNNCVDANHKFLYSCGHFYVENGQDISNDWSSESSTAWQDRTNSRFVNDEGYIMEDNNIFQFNNGGTATGESRSFTNTNFIIGSDPNARYEIAQSRPKNVFIINKKNGAQS